MLADSQCAIRQKSDSPAPDIGLNKCMKPEQVHLIRKSFAVLSRHEYVAALVFYRRLFKLDPSLRPLFGSNIEEQAKKLIEMLAVLIAMIERPVGLELELRAMGARHTDYGVRNEHYVTVGQALLDMLAEVLADKYTPEVQQAWETLYSYIAATMMEGAKSDSQAPHSPP